jgi:predicted CXXCH cytochrome family protein
VARWSRARAQHAPVTQGRCAACHEPHGNASPRFLRKARSALCLDCHAPLAKRLAAKGAVVHAPVVEGCERCHDAHAAGERKLLVAAVPALCAGCHDPASDKLVRAHAPYGRALGRCTGCHDPHVAARPGLIAEVVHPPFAERACDTCHLSPGQSDGRPLVKPDLAATCAECHDDPRTSGHAPVRQGRCVACHSPHASRGPHLLLETGAALCERCHDRGRDRWKKIHADAGAEGMDCSDCHDAHMKKK